MEQRKRILIAVLILAAIVLLVLGVDFVRRQSPTLAAGGQGTLQPGSIPIYLDGALLAGFRPQDLERLQKSSFVEPAEGVLQEGWLLADILRLYMDTEDLPPSTLIVVSSSSRAKEAELTWAEVNESENQVMFDLSNRGTLKLVARFARLDTRDEWVQDTDRIEVRLP